MTTGILTKNPQACFQFKASFSPCTILQMTKYDLNALEQQLTDAIQRAPNFFLGSPVVIDLEKINTIPDIQFAQLRKILIGRGLVPVGVRGGSEEQCIQAKNAELPVLSIGKTTNMDAGNKKPEQRVSPKLITAPIRSGVQIYAKESDLIVTASVSAGAELMADGHIHVYGPLRGRALAGVQGDVQARIFCRTLEAELISIAGYYLTKEDMEVLPAHQGMIQIYLDGEQLRLEAV